MKKLDELIKLAEDVIDGDWLGQHKPNEHLLVTPQTLIKMAETIKDLREVLEWYAENGMKIDVSYMQGRTLVNKWIDVSPKAKAALEQLNKDWANLEGQVHTTGESK